MRTSEQTEGRGGAGAGKRPAQKPARRSLKAALADAGLVRRQSSLSINPESEEPADIAPSSLAADGSETSAFDGKAGVAPEAVDASHPQPQDQDEAVAADRPATQHGTELTPPAAADQRKRRFFWSARAPVAVALPWVKTARRRRMRSRLVNAAAWMATLAVVGGMIGVAATFLAVAPRSTEMAPVAQR